MPPNATPNEPAGSTASTGAEPIVFDIGKQRRKRIKQLRRGEGKLMNEVQAAIGELRRTGSISGNAQPIIIIVREKPRGARGFMPKMF